MNFAEKVEFTVNGIVQKADTSNLNPQTSLNHYLRTSLNLTGTKLMCQEGGCGACVVAIQKPNPSNPNKPIIQAANSCLVPVLACNGWKIQTIEGIADADNEAEKHHFLQKVLTAFNGSQCGFCSPGMVMNMYSLHKNEENLTMKQVENAFGGHICRCTGYRPILSAFKSVCSDASPDLLAQARSTCGDIEEAASRCRKRECGEICKKSLKNNSYYFKLGNSTWIKVFELSDLLAILKLFSSYCLMAGNTGKGVYSNNKVYDIYVDISGISGLTAHKVEKNVEIGANVSLTEAMELFERIGNKFQKFAYLRSLAKHIDLIASVAIRNLGTLAGNLMLKHRHPDFPSDIFVILETVGAKLSVISESGERSWCNVQDLLKISMAGKVIEKIILFPLTNHKFQSYKIMPRAQNAHAIVNAGFLLKINNENHVESSRIVYGNINSSFVHAEALEKFLVGKNLFKNEILQRAFTILDAEIKPESISGEPSSEFRKKLAISLFYKFVLSIAPSKLLTARNKSGSSTLQRLVSSGVQNLNDSESVTEATYKIEALAQTSGQGQYIMDMPSLPQQLFGAFVLAKAPPLSVITKINSSQALKREGVVGFVDSNDIPGENNFTPKALHFADAEEIFCSKKTKFFNQPVGLVVAETQEIAEKAAEEVEVIYSKPSERACVTIRDVLNNEKKAASQKIFLEKEVVSRRDYQKVAAKRTKIVEGSFELSWQYHFHMETQCCNVVPTEDNFDVYPSTQWLDLSQTAIASALNIPANKVNIFVRRLGGAFGAKIVRNSLIACAASIAANKFKKPVKLWMPFKTNMDVIGKRYPLLSNYKVEIDENSIIQNLENVFYADYGYAANEPSMPFLLGTLLSTYNTENWNLKAYSTRTDNSPCCYIRAPGSCEGLAMAEAIIEHAAVAAGIDSLDFRLRNIDKVKNAKLVEMIEELKKSAEIEKRKAEIVLFNKENKWRKRGLSVVPMAYPFHLFGNYGVIVSVYQADGTVAIAHGGVEMGQGINTKAAQVCAYKLGIPVAKIEVKPSNNLIAPNAHMVGGSLTSETVCNGVVKACDVLLERMKPIRDLNKDASWPELVKKCCSEYVNLSASSMSSPKEPELENYTVYGVCAAEIELDVLTGQHVITRVDLIEDVGTSINTNVDIGQVEGAFVMGVGYFTCEKIVIEGESGELVTNRTWNYKPPGAKDIPVDFRVTFPKNTPNKVGVLNSKAMAEPPLCLACCVPLAIRNAVASVRSDSGSEEKWYPFNGPSTVEDTFMNCVQNFSIYTL